MREIMSLKNRRRTINNFTGFPSVSLENKNLNEGIRLLYFPNTGFFSFFPSIELSIQPSNETVNICAFNYN